MSATTAKETASTPRAAAVLVMATTNPARAGPAALVTEKIELSTVLPDRKPPLAPSTEATAARERALAVRATIPSAPARTRTSGSEKSVAATTANAAKTVASIR